MPETDHSDDGEIASPETVFDQTDIFVPTIDRSTNGPDFRIDTDAECLTGRSIEAVRDLLESVLRKWDYLIEPESEAWHATKARSGILPDDIHSFNGALRIPNNRIVWDDGEVSRESGGWVYKGYLRDSSSAIGADTDILPALKGELCACVSRNETDETDETDTDDTLDIDRDIRDPIARIEARQHGREDEIETGDDDDESDGDIGSEADGPDSESTVWYYEPSDDKQLTVEVGGEQIAVDSIEWDLDDKPPEIDDEDWIDSIAFAPLGVVDSCETPIRIGPSTDADTDPEASENTDNGENGGA
jgi:hypothetical protein